MISRGVVGNPKIWVMWGAFWSIGLHPRLAPRRSKVQILPLPILFSALSNYDGGTCLSTAFTSDVTSQLNRRERGGASDSKKPDPYYLVDKTKK